MSSYFKRDKSIYENYVCPHCFYTMDKCTCEVYPKYSILWIDKGIQEHIRILNEKGYRTQYSCESHYPKSQMYIMFCSAHKFTGEYAIPEDFKQSGCMIEYKSKKKKIEEEEFELQKQKHLSALLDWCKALPSIKENKK